MDTNHEHFSAFQAKYLAAVDQKYPQSHVEKKKTHWACSIRKAMLAHSTVRSIWHIAARDIPHQSLIIHLLLALMKYCTTLKETAMTSVH